MKEFILGSLRLTNNYKMNILELTRQNIALVKNSFPTLLFSKYPAEVKLHRLHPLLFNRCYITISIVDQTNDSFEKINLFLEDTYGEPDYCIHSQNFVWFDKEKLFSHFMKEDRLGVVHHVIELFYKPLEFLIRKNNYMNIYKTMKKMAVEENLIFKMMNAGMNGLNILFESSVFQYFITANKKELKIYLSENTIVSEKITRLTPIWSHSKKVKLDDDKELVISIKELISKARDYSKSAKKFLNN